MIQPYNFLSVFKMHGRSRILHNIRSGLAKFAEWAKPGVKSLLGHVAQAGLDYAQKQLPGAMMTPTLDEEPEVANPTWGYQAPPPHKIWNTQVKKQAVKHVAIDASKFDKSDLKVIARLLRLSKRLKRAETKDEYKKIRYKLNDARKDVKDLFGLTEEQIRSSPALLKKLKKINEKRKVKKGGKGKKSPPPPSDLPPMLEDEPVHKPKAKKVKDKDIEEFVKIKKTKKVAPPPKKVTLKEHAKYKDAGKKKIKKYKAQDFD